MNGWGALVCFLATLIAFAFGRFVGHASAYEQLCRWVIEEHKNQNACPACNEVEAHAPGCPLAELAERESE